MIFTRVLSMSDFSGQSSLQLYIDDSIDPPLKIPES